VSVVDWDAPEEITFAGKWVTARRRGRWEYVTRAKGIRAAVILALDGPPHAREVVLIDQYRVPVGGRCLELPAGLIGDDVGGAGEDPLSAAKRELEEETGYRAREWTNLGEFWSSPGMLGESFSLVRASDLEQVGPGGGDEHEDIVVHRVPVSDISRFVADARTRGLAIDVRILAVLGGGMIGLD
jgi:ADP-ribose pyrophosphatase